MPPPGDRGAGLRVTTGPALPRPGSAHKRAHALFFTPKVQRRHWFLGVPISKSGAAGAGAAGACADNRTTPRLLYPSPVLPQISALLQDPAVWGTNPRLWAGSIRLTHRTRQHPVAGPWPIPQDGRAHGSHPHGSCIVVVFVCTFSAKDKP